MLPILFSPESDREHAAVSVDKAVAVVAEMPEITAAFTSCSCSHSRPANTSSAAVAMQLNSGTNTNNNSSTSRQPSRNEYASALQPTIKAAQAAHARMEQCREWANVVAVAARDAEHADHVPGFGTSNPYANAGKARNAYTSPHSVALNGFNAGPARSVDPLPDPHPQPEPVVEETYPPTAPAKWYDDPVADARSRSGSRAASRANTPTRGLNMTSTNTNTNASTNTSASVAGSTAASAPAIATTTISNRRPSTSALSASADLKRSHDEEDDDEPYPKRRSAPASPARPRSMLAISPRTTPAHSPRTSPDTRPRPLLSGTIASRTGPALAQVRAAFASVGVDSVSGSTTGTSSSSPPGHKVAVGYAASAPDGSLR